MACGRSPKHRPLNTATLLSPQHRSPRPPARILPRSPGAAAWELTAGLAAPPRGAARVRLVLRLLQQPLCEVVPIVRCQGRQLLRATPLCPVPTCHLSVLSPMKTGFLGPDLLAQGASEKEPAVGGMLPVCT